MAVTPKVGRGRPRTKAGSATLSASEALKAAEAAITPASPKQAVAKKPRQQKPAVPAAEWSDDNPAAIVAATTAVDAAPEPEVVDQPSTAAAPETTTLETTPLPATEGTKTMNDYIEKTKTFADNAKAKFETAYADFNEKTRAGVEKSTKAIEELSDITKGNVEAMVESGKIAAKGMETLGQEAVDYGRKSFEKATASFKSFSTVKTPTEFFQLHSQLMSSSFDDFTKEAARSSEALLKLAGDVAQPLTARVTVVTDKVKSLAA